MTLTAPAYFDAPLLLALPGGVHGTLLAAFAGLGVVCTAYALAWEPRARAAMCLHVAGGTLALLAADLVTMLIGWELLSFSAFFLIASGGRRVALRAARRYLAFQIVAAAALFAGIVVQVAGSGSLDVAVALPEAQPLLLAAIAIKTAAIPLHGWLVDGYPQAPPAVAPLLSVYATKVGVYTAARLLALPPVAVLGAVMAVAGVICALGQHTGRRLLAYHIVSQVGYMLAGVGMATELGITAGMSHAVNHIVYKALLFMVIGAVILRTGHDRLGALGGLARAMPLTFAAGAVASASISGLPPFNGFASKELLKAAVGAGPVGMLLTAATVGTGLSFTKFMYLVFLRPRTEAYPEPPREIRPAMLPPMGALALLCLATGIWPSWVAVGVDHAYYTPAALTHALLPLVGSLLLWGVFRRRLIRPRTAHVGPAVGRWAQVAARRVRAGARAAHSLSWQSALALALAFWTIAALLLSRGEDVPHGGTGLGLQEAPAQRAALEHPGDLGQEADVSGDPGGR